MAKIASIAPYLIQEVCNRMSVNGTGFGRALSRDIACFTLHDTFGWGKVRLSRFLGEADSIHRPFPANYPLSLNYRVKYEIKEADRILLVPS